MIKTIKELLIEWWAGNATTKMLIPTIYTYEVDVDGSLIHIESMRLKTPSIPSTNLI